MAGIRRGWRPLSRRDDPTYDDLRTELTSGLRHSLRRWVTRWFVASDPTGLLGPDYAIDLLERVARVLDLDLNWRTPEHAFESLLNVDDSTLLDVVDYLLGTVGEYSAASVAEEVDEYFAEARSAWRAVECDGVARLERRVSPTVRESAEAVMSSNERAGQHLAEAWSYVYGRHSDASRGYHESVRAVEVALKPIVSPRNERTTLGTIIGHMEAAPSKWRVALGGGEEVDAVAVFINMLRLLWKSQIDRHGTDDDTVPFAVSDSEAEAALHLALTIVSWATAGAVRQGGA